MTSEDDFAPIWEESILLAEHEAVQASVDVGGWLSAALDDPNVCDQMKADINRWFSSGFLYLDSVRQLMQADREAVRAEVARAIEVELSMCAIANVEAPSEWIDGFEFAWKRVKEALRQYKEARDV